MVNPRLKDELNDQLCQAMLSLETQEECYAFFEDVCTIGELKAMAQRLEVARMLRAGSTYDMIVKRCLNYGADGYRIVLDRIDSTERSEAVTDA